MKILYDGEIYGLQKIGGISRYFDNIIARLPSDFYPLLTIPRSQNEPHPHHPNLKLFHYKRFGFRPGRVSLWLEPHYFQCIEAINNYQVFHPTYYTSLTHQKFKKKRCPVVITVYDMIHELYTDLIDQNGEMAALKRQAILTADVIICISESTKRDLLALYSLPEERVWVTHLATEFNPNLGYGNEPIPSCPFFLHVGGRSTYKNFDNLLIAFSKLVSKVPDVILSVVGSPFDSAEQRIIADTNLENHIQNFGYVSDSHLAKLYRNCIAFVYPSLYEGFGIPPLEAMICQAPVIASNTSSIQEVVGDAGLLFDPTSVTDLVERLLFLIGNPLKRDHLIAKGLQQVKKFSWEQTVVQTVKVYQYALDYKK